MTVRSRVASAVAAASLAVGVALSLRPGLAPRDATEIVADVGVAEFVTGVAGLAGLYLLYRVRVRTAVPTAAAPPVSDPPEEAIRPARAVAGGDFDATLEAARAGQDGGDATAELERVRGDLRDAAARAYAHANGVTDERARSAIRRGEWTDDQRAAAFLGPEAPSLPLRVKALDWVIGADRVDARASRAVDEIERTVNDR